MISIFSNSGIKAYGIKEYILDTKEDLAELSYIPGAGSMAFILSTNEYYMCDSNGNWTKVNAPTGGSSGSTGGSGTGATGPQGPAGESAYQIAVRNGFTGTEQEWLDSLYPQIGEDLQWYVNGEPTGIKAQVSDYDDLENKPTIDGQPLDELETIDHSDILNLFSQE